MKSTNCLACCALLGTLAGCSADNPPADFSVLRLAAPTADAATSPRLAGGRNDELVLSWLQADGDNARLRYSRLVNGAWSAAATVVETQNMFVNWADLPSVVPLGGGHLAAHWLLAEGGGHAHAYNIAFSESRDDGLSWSPAITPHDDGTDTEHGFVSIYPAGGAAGLLWLDGRKTISPASADPVASGTMLLSTSGTVDELVCDCCQTDVAVAASGPVAVYRDRSADEVRDIYVARRIDGNWQAGVPVAHDNWRIDGCPVNGPSIAADGERVAVAWFTAVTEPLVQVAVSTDSGASFEAPIEVIRSAALGRAAVALLDDGDVAVSWLELTDAAVAAVKARRILRDGSLGPVRLIGHANALSVPQMARHGAQLVFAWTRSPAGSPVTATALVDIASL